MLADVTVVLALTQHLDFMFSPLVFGPSCYLQSEASVTHRLYSGRTEAWSWISRSFTWVRIANFQLSSTWVRLEQVLPLVYSAEDRNSMNVFT